MTYGDKVRFVLAPDIEALVIAMMVEGNLWHYKVAWIDQGERKTDWVHSSEVEKIRNNSLP